jgi:hypothetical protein
MKLKCVRAHISSNSVHFFSSKTFPCKMGFNPLIRIPMPDVVAIEQLAQFSTPNGLICVYWVRDTKQAVFEHKDNWYIQNDSYIIDALSEILGIKESNITVDNLLTGNMHDASSFCYADTAMSNGIYQCKWSDYTCDYLIMQADVDY